MADKPKKKFQVHKLYEISGTVIKRKNRTCPKCGKAVFMARHGDRETCGKCGYSEIHSSKKKQE